jgi:hypothetical protein
VGYLDDILSRIFRGMVRCKVFLNQQSKSLKMDPVGSLFSLWFSEISVVFRIRKRYECHELPYFTGSVEKTKSEVNGLDAALWRLYSGLTSQRLAWFIWMQIIPQFISMNSLSPQSAGHLTSCCTARSLQNVEKQK